MAFGVAFSLCCLFLSGFGGLGFWAAVLTFKSNGSRVLWEVYIRELSCFFFSDAALSHQDMKRLLDK